MTVVALLVFIGLVLVGGALVLFGHSLVSADHEHADRLALLPMEEDENLQRRTTRSAETPPPVT